MFILNETTGMLSTTRPAVSIVENIQKYFIVISPFVRLSVYLPECQSVGLSVFIYLSVCPSGGLSVRLSIRRYTSLIRRKLYGINIKFNFVLLQGSSRKWFSWLFVVFLQDRETSAQFFLYIKSSNVKVC